MAAAVLLLYIQVALDRLKSGAQQVMVRWRYRIFRERDRALADQDRMRNALERLILSQRHIKVRRLIERVAVWRLSMIAGHFYAIRTSLGQSTSETQVALESTEARLDAKEREIYDLRASHRETFEETHRAHELSVDAIRLTGQEALDQAESVHRGEIELLAADMEGRKRAAEELARLLEALQAETVSEVRFWGLRALAGLVPSMDGVRRCVGVWKAKTRREAYVRVCVALGDAEEDYAKLAEVCYVLPRPSVPLYDITLMSSRWYPLISHSDGTDTHTHGPRTPLANTSTGL